jgi:hypothetical protein
MTINLTRTHRPRRPSHRAEQYPNDYLHNDRTYAETQSDIGGVLFLGAITLIALMTLVVVGLV